MFSEDNVRQAHNGTESACPQENHSLSSVADILYPHSKAQYARKYPDVYDIDWAWFDLIKTE